MKKYIYMIAAAALAFASCAKEVVKDVDTPVSEGKMMTFKAVVEDPIMDAETKASLSRGGVFAWDGEEEVCFFKDNGESVMGTVSADGSTIEVTAGEYVCAVYPGAAASLKNKVSFDAPGPVIVAKVNGSNLEFHHIGSLVNIKIANAPSTSTLEFTSSATAGDGTFSFDSDGKPVLAAGTIPVSISVENVKAAQLAAGLTISVPNVSYAAGFTVGIKDGARYVYKKEATAKEKYGQLATRGKLLNMKALDYVPSSKFYISTFSPTGYWDVNAFRMIQTGNDEYTASINCDGNTMYYVFDEYNTNNPSTCYLASGLAKESLASGVSPFELVVCSQEDPWESNSYPMEFEGDWHYIKNIQFPVFGSSGESYARMYLHNTSDNTYHKGVNVWVEGTDTYKTTTDDWDIYVKPVNGNLSSENRYDLFYNSSTFEIRVKLSSSKHDPNEQSGVFKFVYNSSTQECSIVRKGDKIDSVFGDGNKSIETDFRIKGSYNGWGNTSYLSYKQGANRGNKYWTGTITVEEGKTGTIEFLLATNDNCTTYKTGSTGTESGKNYTQVVNSGNPGNAKVVLPEAGTYAIYLNALEYESRFFNIMFEKQ